MGRVRLSNAADSEAEASEKNVVRREISTMQALCSILAEEEEEEDNSSVNGSCLFVRLVWENVVLFLC